MSSDTTNDDAKNDAKAWGDFWASNAAGGANGCLPERWAAIETAQKTAWAGFVETLPQGTRVLDLATGDGRVLRWMKEARSDLSLTGIDLAPELPEAPEGTETRGGIAMEDLPFDDDSFDAVVSQFGFEYGDSAKIAAEIGRVLGKDGVVGLMLHRGDGPILEHNRVRTAAIDWAINEKQIAATIGRALDTQGAGPSVAAQVAAALAMLGERAHGKSSPAWEIPEAVRQACLMGGGAGVASIHQTIAAITDQAANEIGRIESLERACATADNRDALASAFSDAGLALAATSAIEEPSGRALADFVTFS